MMQDECFCVTPDGKEGSSRQDMEWQTDNCLQAGKTYEWDRTNVTQLSFLQINGFVCIQREKDVVNKKD